MTIETANGAATAEAGSGVDNIQPTPDPVPNPAPAPAPEQPAQPAPESNPANDGAKNGEATDVADKDTAPANEWMGAPEGTYSAEGFDLPEGYEVDETTAEGLAQVCKEMGLSQKAFATIVNRMTPVLEQAQREQIAALKQENLKAFAADKELGGTKAKATIAQAKQAYEKYCPEDCRQILNRLGLDAHPGMIRMFYQLSQLLSDDVIPRSSGASTDPDAVARSFFNNSKMN